MQQSGKVPEVSSGEVGTHTKETTENPLDLKKDGMCTESKPFTITIQRKETVSLNMAL